jgi:hypothetical protein
MERIEEYIILIIILLLFIGCPIICICCFQRNIYGKNIRKKIRVISYNINTLENPFDNEQMQYLLKNQNII